jgi:hypothetical protein
LDEEPGKAASITALTHSCTRFGPAMVSGALRRALNSASSMKKGRPPIWSAWKCVSRIAEMLLGSMPARCMASSDVAPQSTSITVPSSPAR